MNPDSVMSVSDLCRDIGMSRGRFYQLIKQGVFPPPVYDTGTRRPYFTRELAEQVREVRRSNVGVNGKIIMFYSARRSTTANPRRNRPVQPKQPSAKHAELLDSLKALGLTNVTVPQLTAAITECFPNGMPDGDSGEVIRVLFLNLSAAIRS